MSGLHPDDLADAPSPLEATNGAVNLRWLGTAGYELECEGHVLLIDPYFTRVPLWRLFAPVLSLPDEARIRAGVTRADAIVVGHSHFDHVLDVPTIARMTGATVYGSESTTNLMAAAGLPESQVVTCVGHDTFETGPFRVTMVPSEHSRFAFGRTPFGGDIPCSCELPMRAGDYRCGLVFGIHIAVAGLSLYHMGSAELVDDQLTTGSVDLCLLGISGRHHTERYIPRALRLLQPRVVMPMHYDNFFRTLDKPMQLLPLTRFEELIGEVSAFDRDATVRTLRMGQQVSLRA